jgi:hypothetical protein
MANTDEPTDSQAPKPVTQTSKIEMGLNWNTGMVVVQAVTKAEGQADVATIINIPADAFVQAGASVCMQLVQRLQQEREAASGSGGRILKVMPGQVPGDLRRKH